jgi:hypothetical protein
MHIGQCIVSTKSTRKLKFWILRTGNKRMTRTGITQQYMSKSVEGLTMFAGSSFPDILNWTFPYIFVPTQNPKDDCTFFCMLYLENYNGRDQEMDIQIDKDSWHFISAIFFLLSIPSHSFMLANCHSLYFLLMHLFIVF